MSTHAASSSSSIPAASTSSSGAGKALGIGFAGLAVTAVGIFVSGAQQIAYSYLVGFSFCAAILIGMLMLILIHHIFDASWSVLIRRQFEHGITGFKWLALLFIPLAITPFLPGHSDLVWPWMNPEHVMHGGHTVEHDVLYTKKAGFLNVNMFLGMSAAFFIIWVWLSARLRKASFAQDLDGDAKWTFMNRKTAAFGIPLLAFSLTFAAIYWIKSLEYHWFSTMYGVWFFANCVRGALSIGVIIMVWLIARGDYRGVVNKNHFYSIGLLVFAFTVFWAYVTFSQYFLIWNANVPEETFWYNLREIHADGTPSQWKYVGFFILFFHFVAPFLLLLSYRFKVTPHIIRRIAYMVLFTILIDLCYNILPALKDAHGDPLPFLSINLLWVLTSIAGVGGICVWSYLKSFPTTKILPIRDPRIGECLTYHE